MTTMQQFLDERQGKFTQQDLMFLARKGMESLLPDVYESLSLEQEESAPVIDTRPYHVRDYFGVQMGYLGQPVEDLTLTSLSNAVNSTCQVLANSQPGYTPRILVVGSEFGEEVIAACAGGGAQGQNVNSLHEMKSDEQAHDIYLANLEESPLTSQMIGSYFTQSSTESAMQWDPQEYDMIILCNPDRAAVQAWMKHVLPMGYLVTTGATRSVEDEFGSDVVVVEGECAMVYKDRLERKNAVNNSEELPAARPEPKEIEEEIIDEDAYLDEVMDDALANNPEMNHGVDAKGS